MKKIVLLGDSIRLGYEAYVRDALSGVAEIYAPTENCRFAQYFFRYAHEWKSLGKWPSDVDVVHWNAGLWDALRLMGDEPLTPCDIYVYYLRRIHAMLRKLFPEAKIIFALSTAILEEKAGKDFFRYNADIEQYNAAASALMEELGVPVNDLYTVSKNLDDSLHCDWVHFGDEGSEILAKAVTEAILKELN